MRVLAPLALLVPLSLAAACEEELPRSTVEPAAPPVVDAGEDAAVDAGQDSSPVPKGARTLGVAVSVGDVAFADQVRDVAAIGARTTNAAFAWNDVERPEDGGAPVLFHPGIHVVGLVVSGAGMKASVALDAMDATGPRLPADLAGRALDDPEVATRYEAATDYVLSQLPDLALTAFLVGTDVDVPLGGDAGRWAAFTTFFERVASHARTKRAGLRVGFVIGSAALANERDRVGPALAAADVVAVSHAGDVSADLEPIVAASPAGKPIVIHAVGRPSAPDEQAQAAFVRGVFAAWDRHPDRIPVLTFFELDDRPGTASTFGLRRYADGRGKPAFAVLAAESRARGF